MLHAATYLATLQKTRNLVYFFRNPQLNFSLLDMLRRWGVTHAISSTTCLAMLWCGKLQKKLLCVTAPLDNKLLFHIVSLYPRCISGFQQTNFTDCWVQLRGTEQWTRSILSRVEEVVLLVASYNLQKPGLTRWF